jgi:hypothetical protein
MIYKSLTQQLELIKKTIYFYESKHLAIIKMKHEYLLETKSRLPTRQPYTRLEYRRVRAGEQRYIKKRNQISFSFLLT